MKELSKDPSKQEMIECINNLVGVCNALSKTIVNISDNNRSNFIIDQINTLEKKIIAQGDLIVKLFGG